MNKVFYFIIRHILVFCVFAAALFWYGTPILADNLANIPKELRTAVNQTLYRVESTELGRYDSENPENGMTLGFDPKGMRFASIERTPGWQWKLELKGYGTPGAAQPVKRAELATMGHKIEYRRGPITEWYENRPEGLEQGFTLTRPPVAGASDVELLLEIGDELQAQLDGRGMRLSDKSGRAVLAYRNLDVIDARGRHLPARAALADMTLTIQIDARGAVWPVVVDLVISNPTVKLTAQNSDVSSDAQASGHFGWAIALSQDGNTALVGAHGASMSGLDKAGAVYVFKRNGQVWSIQQKLNANNPDGSGDAVGGGYFGYSVALSADGNTAMVGAYGATVAGQAQAGAVYVYGYNNGVWSIQQKLLAQTSTGDDVQATASFGYSIALAANGNTVLVGALGSRTSGLIFSGAVYIYSRAATSWSFEQKLTAQNKDGDDDALSHAAFGASVALAADGATALIGAPGYTVSGQQYAGASYLYSRVGSSWTIQDKLTAKTREGEDADSNAGFGVKVVLSADGQTAVVGEPGRRVGLQISAGAVYIFGRSGGNWEIQHRITAQDERGDDESWSYGMFGSAIERSSNGDTILIGAPGAKVSGQDSAGVLYVYRPTAEGWMSQQKLTAHTSEDGDVAANAYFGYPVALSADGETLWVGANRIAASGQAQAGAVYVTGVRRRVPATPPVQNTLQVALAGSNSASAVASKPAGIDCGVTCAGNFSKEDAVYLRACSRSSDE